MVYLQTTYELCFGEAYFEYFEADIFQYQSYSHSDDMFIILKSNIKTDTSTFVYLYFRRKNHMIQNIQNTLPQNIVHK
jgi:hypothetical protein